VSAETAQTLEGILAARFSCRGFKPDPVPRAVIERILTMAQRVPSWCNAQPWKVEIASGETRKRFSEGLLADVKAGAEKPDFPWPRAYEGAYLERRRTCGFQLYNAVGVPRGDRAAANRQGRRNYEFFDAPHVAVIHSEEALGVYGAVDCGGFVTGFTLAAQSLGVATIAQAAIAPYAPFIRDFFGLPENRLIVCGISFGYADMDAPANGFRTQRAALDDVVAWHE